MYPGTDVLRNHFDIRDPQDLREAEYEHTRQRLSEPLPPFDLTLASYQALHRHIFQDIFPWAGELRTIDIAKGGSYFASARYLQGELDKCFAAMRNDARLPSPDQEQFLAAAAEHLNEINARHPFRDGNGRTQRALLEVLAERFGHRIEIEKIDPDKWIEASIIGFHKADHTPMQDVLRKAFTKP